MGGGGWAVVALVLIAGGYRPPDPPGKERKERRRALRARNCLLFATRACDFFLFPDFPRGVRGRETPGMKILDPLSHPIL